MDQFKFTLGPWHLHERHPGVIMGGSNENGHPSQVADATLSGFRPDEERIANARLIAAAPAMLAELLSVRKLISEAAMTGFNCKDGDWAERLFANQGKLTDAINRATRT